MHRQAKTFSIKLIRNHQVAAFETDMEEGVSTRPETAVSALTSHSGKSGQILIATLTTTSWKGRSIQGLKLCLLTVPSLIVILALCGLSLRTASTAIQLQNTLQKNIHDAQSVGQLATALQMERGKTCVYVTGYDNQTNSTNQVALSLAGVISTRKDTDIALKNVQTWLGNSNEGPEFADKKSFAKSLKHFRSALQPGDDSDCDATLEFYTPITRKLIEQLNRPFAQTEDGSFWSHVEAYHALLLAKDYFGLQRAMGGAFFSQGAFNSLADFAAFSKVVGAGDQLLQMALNLMPSSGQIYYQVTSNQTFMSDMNSMRQEILDAGLDRLPPNPEKGQAWFQNMTNYLALIEQIDKYLSDLIVGNLERKTATSRMEYYMTIVAVVACLILCPPITCWYAIQTRGLMYKIDCFLQKLTTQTNELKVETQRTDLLLYQLLPKTVAVELKLNKMVAPEHYEETTVYFSDIQGFTALATKSTVMQVIEFLNQLYTKCDHILDQNDVYKVETIGDAYMVVSGVPRRNGKNHSAEMASAALKILMAMDDFYIPHMPDQRLLMRIGVHTGPVAAGVVGNKMPRYCLFGDTVTRASKMEATSQALRVQISSCTNNHLQKWHPNIFDTMERGTVEINNRESITTYWLLGKRGLPFRVDLDKTERLLEETTYWRS